MDGHWAKADVENLAGRLVVNGYEDGSFRPDNGVTRSEFAAMTVRALGLVKLPSQGFADAQPGAWYDAFVGGAKAYGIIAGYEDGSFRPGDPITRQEAMVMIQRAAKLCGMEQGEGGSLDAYADGGEVAAWAQNAVLFCTQNGIIQGSGGLLSPQKQISRGETAAILLRLLQKAGWFNRPKEELCS